MLLVAKHNMAPTDNIMGKSVLADYCGVQNRYDAPNRMHDWQHYISDDGGKLPF